MKAYGFMSGGSRFFPEANSTLFGLRSILPVAGMGTILFLALLLPPISADAAEFTTPVQLTSGDDAQSTPMIAVDSNGYSHITWFGSDGATYQIWYSDNTSGSWATAEQLTTATGSNHQTKPEIAVDSNGYSHITWYGNASSGAPNQIWYTNNTSGSWATPTQLTSGSNEQYLPQIAIDSDNNSHITWYGSNGTADQIWYTDNTSGSWSTNPLTSAASGQSQFSPQIALDSDGYSHITWAGRHPTSGTAYQIWYIDNTSGSWSTTQLTTGTNSQEYPKIAVDSNGYSHITWNGVTEGGNINQIWYATNTSGSWSTTQLTSATAGHQFYPEIALGSDNTPHITWLGRHPTEGGAYQIWYANNASGSWATSQLTNAAGSNDQLYPEIAVDSNGSSHITWYGNHPENGEPNQIWYADNTSGSWPTPTQLTSAAGEKNQRYPQIALDTDNISHITWYGAPPVTYPQSKNALDPTQIWYIGAVGPTVTGLDPDSGYNTQSEVSVTVSGSNFQSGATLTLTGPDTIGPVDTNGSGSTLTATLDLTGKTAGTYTATVTNPDMISADKEDAFTVIESPFSNALVVTPGTLQVGKKCSLGIQLNENITEPFDFYNLAQGRCGAYTVYFNGTVVRGIRALVRSIPQYSAPVSLTLQPDYVFPAALLGKQITFYSVVVQAGKIPPVSSLSELTSTTQYVIMMGKDTATVEQ